MGVVRASYRLRRPFGETEFFFLSHATLHKLNSSTIYIKTLYLVCTSPENFDTL